MRRFAYKTPVGAWMAEPIVRDMQRLLQTSARLPAEGRSLEVSSNKSSAPTRKDFFFYLFRGNDPETGKAYSDGELVSESNPY